MRNAFRFFTATGLASVSGLLCTLVVAHVHGGDAFLSLAVGQAIGGLVAILATWGWDVSGPQRVARLSPEDALSALSSSVRTRASVWFLTMPLGLAITAALSPSGFLVFTLLNMLAVSSQALSPTWWASARSTPRTLLRFDTYPRALAGIASALIIVGGGPVEMYPGLTLIATGVAYAAFYNGLLRGVILPRRVRLGTALRRNASAVAIATVGSSYTTAVLPLVQATAPRAALGFAAAYRLVGYTNLLTISLTNAFMGSRSEDQRRRRFWTLILVSTAVAVGVIAMAPALSRILFNVPLSSPLTRYLLAGIYLAVAINTALSKLWLIPAGHQRLVLAAGIVSAALGLPIATGLAITRGADGALGGMLAAEVIFVIWCVLGSRLLTSSGRP